AVGKAPTSRAARSLGRCGGRLRLRNRDPRRIREPLARSTAPGKPPGPRSFRATKPPSVRRRRRSAAPWTTAGSAGFPPTRRPAHGAALRAVAALHAGRGNYPAARALAEAATELAPTSPESWRMLAHYVVQGRAGQLWPAIQAWTNYAEAILRSPARLASML